MPNSMPNFIFLFQSEKDAAYFTLAFISVFDNNPAWDYIDYPFNEIKVKKKKKTKKKTKERKKGKRIEREKFGCFVFCVINNSCLVLGLLHSNNASWI